MRGITGTGASTILLPGLRVETLQQNWVTSHEIRNKNGPKVLFKQTNVRRCFQTALAFLVSCPFNGYLTGSNLFAYAVLDLQHGPSWRVLHSYNVFSSSETGHKGYSSRVHLKSPLLPQYGKMLL